MRKLNQPGVNEICRRMADGKLSVWRIAKQARVSKQWVYELYNRYKLTGAPPVRQRCGCKPQDLSLQLKQKIKELHLAIPCSALTMEQRLHKQGLKVSHNKIHTFLVKEKLSKKEPKKSKRRKWVRYERTKGEIGG